jgi:spore coat protein U-like protein
VKTFINFGAAAFCLFLAGEVHAACTVTTTSVTFGNYDVFVTTPVDSTGAVTVSCTQTTNVTVAIGPSANSGGFNPRTMRHASLPDRMNYNLFTNASRNVIWGDGTAGTSTVLLSQVRRNQPRVTTIYGRITPGQDISVGSYSDTLMVTITP